MQIALAPSPMRRRRW